MTEPRPETLTLQRARSGQDLWTAIEAAQYARLIRHEDPQSDAEAAGMQAFVGLFSDCAERWEAQSPDDQSLALKQVDAHVAALGELELFVFWGVLEGKLGAADVQIAVIIIGRNGDNRIEVAMPATIEIEEP